MLCCFSNDVNFEELARCTDDFNGAMCKAVCVEAVSVLTSCNFLVRTSLVRCILAMPACNTLCIGLSRA